MNGLGTICITLAVATLIACYAIYSAVNYAATGPTLAVASEQVRR